MLFLSVGTGEKFWSYAVFVCLQMPNGLLRAQKVFRLACFDGFLAIEIEQAVECFDIVFVQNKGVKSIKK